MVKGEKGSGMGGKNIAIVVAAFAILVAAAVVITAWKGATGTAITPPADLTAKACGRINPPFWAIDCNTAFAAAYNYAAQNYGSVGDVVRATLRVTKNYAHYIFGFREGNTTVCVVVNAINERDVNAAPESTCVPQTASTATG